MKILGENKAFNIINARRKARELSAKTITKDKISKDFFQTEEESAEEKKGIKIPGLANTPFNPAVDSTVKVGEGKTPKKRSSGFTPVADRLEAKGVVNLRPTAAAKPAASAKAAAPKKPRTGSNKTANRRYEKEMRAYNRQNQTLTKGKQAKRETEAMVTRAKGLSATALEDYVRANKLVRTEAKIKGKIAKANKKMSGAVNEKTKKGTYNFAEGKKIGSYDFVKGIKVSRFKR